MPDIRIERLGLDRLDTLLKWRMEVLRDVFSLPAEKDMTELYEENETYYRREIPSGGHIACLASIGEEEIGTGGICLHEEMPSPDNPTGKCAYLMNIYVRDAWRGHGVGKRMVRTLVGLALEQGISKIYLETSECGRKLYETVGFSEMPDMLQLR